MGALSRLLGTTGLPVAACCFGARISVYKALASSLKVVRISHGITFRYGLILNFSLKALNLVLAIWID